MNLNKSPTVEQFRELLEQHDDRAGHHVLWVRRDGEVMLTCLPRGDYRKVPLFEHPELQLRCDLFRAGYGFVGTESDDDGWFKGKLFDHLRQLWAKVGGTPGVTRIDLDSVAPEGRPVDDEERAELKRFRDERLRKKLAGELGRCHITPNP